MKKFIATIVSLIICISVIAVPMTALAENIITIDYAFSYGANADGKMFEYYLDTDIPDTLFIDGEGETYDFDYYGEVSVSDEWTFENWMTFNTQVYLETLYFETLHENDNFLNPKTIVISEGITYLGNAMFLPLTRTEALYIPDSVEKLGEHAFPENTKAIVYCSADSCAVKYGVDSTLRVSAEGYDRLGDANADGKVTAADVLQLRKALASWKVGYVIQGADVNSDGKVTAADVLIVRKHLANWDTVISKEPSADVAWTTEA